MFVRPALRASRVASAAGFVCLLWLASSAAAQVGTGRVSGSVRDERGRPLKGATVSATNEGIARTLTAATDEKGRFSIIGFGFGTWKFQIEAEGFHPFTFEIPIRTMQPTPPIEVTLVKRPAPAPPPLLGNVDAAALQRELDGAASLVTGGQIAAAIAAYRRLLGRYPALTSINLQLGYLFERNGDHDAALAAYRAALQADPSGDSARSAIQRLTP